MTLRFCGIGAMRTASTWTYRCLDLHPDVAFPAGKQIHFLDQHLDQGLDWYRALFADSPAPFCGDITPAYATVGDEAVDLMADAFPELRVFFVIRDPIDRAWSSARLSIRRDELDPSTLDTDWYRHRLTRPSVAVRNAYEKTYERWKKRFGDAFWLADFGGLQDDPQGFLIALSDHLGIDSNAYSAPSPQMRDAFTERLNATENLHLAPDVDRDALDDAIESAYAADVDWYRSAPLDWPPR